MHTAQAIPHVHAHAYARSFVVTNPQEIQCIWCEMTIALFNIQHDPFDWVSDTDRAQMKFPNSIHIWHLFDKCMAAHYAVLCTAIISKHSICFWVWLDGTILNGWGVRVHEIIHPVLARLKILFNSIQLNAIKLTNNLIISNAIRFIVHCYPFIQHVIKCYSN